MEFWSLTTQLLDHSCWAFVTSTQSSNSTVGPHTFEPFAMCVLATTSFHESSLPSSHHVCEVHQRNRGPLWQTHHIQFFFRTRLLRDPTLNSCLKIACHLRQATTFSYSHLWKQTCWRNHSSLISLVSLMFPGKDFFLLCISYCIVWLRTQCELELEVNLNLNTQELQKKMWMCWNERCTLL